MWEMMKNNKLIAVLVAVAVVAVLVSVAVGEPGVLDTFLP